MGRSGAHVARWCSELQRGIKPSGSPSLVWCVTPWRTSHHWHLVRPTEVRGLYCVDPEAETQPSKTESFWELSNTDLFVQNHRIIPFMARNDAKKHAWLKSMPGYLGGSHTAWSTRCDVTSTPSDRRVSFIPCSPPPPAPPTSHPSAHRLTHLGGAAPAHDGRICVWVPAHLPDAPAHTSLPVHRGIQRPDLAPHHAS